HGRAGDGLDRAPHRGRRGAHSNRARRMSSTAISSSNPPERTPMSALVAYAKAELNRLYEGREPDNDYDRAGRDAVLELVETFAEQGHSGFSAAWTLGVAKKLMAFEPLSPLTGDDDEWTDIGEMNGSPCWQNKRCSHVFKDGDGRAYDIQGRVFREA